MQSGCPNFFVLASGLFVLCIAMCFPHPIFLVACTWMLQGEPQSSRPLLLHLPSLEQFLTEAMAGCVSKEGRPAIITGEATLGMPIVFGMMSSIVDKGSTHWSGSRG